MKKETSIQLFEQKQVRSVWNDDEEKWYFSIVDVIDVLTDSPNPQVYWRVLKKRLKDEGNETVTNCNGLKMQSVINIHGLIYNKAVTDCNRLIQQNY